jgi:hypothetical protein
MVDPFKGVPYSFGALRKTYGRLYVRCDVCRRFALLQLGPHKLRDVDSRTKRFSCSVCGDEAWLTVTDPRTERGMKDYRLDQREDPVRHPAAVDRLLGRRRRRRRPVVDQTGGELPGRKVDPRR